MISAKDFVELKAHMAQKPILRTTDFTKLLCVATDVSNRWIGGYLFQTVDGTEYPICNYSKVLQRYQRNYSTVEKECLSLLYSFSKFKNLLWRLGDIGTDRYFSASVLESHGK